MKTERKIGFRGDTCKFLEALTTCHRVLLISRPAMLCELRDAAADTSRDMAAIQQCQAAGLNSILFDIRRLTARSSLSHPLTSI